MIKPTAVDTVVSRKQNLRHGYFALTLSPYDRAVDCRPGQFVHVQLPSTDIMFRRAMSVAGATGESGELEIIFKVFGRGTRLMGQLHRGDRINVLGPLGKPFTMPKKTARTVLVAGGVGFPPLMYLAQKMIAQGYDPDKIEFFYGGRTRTDLLRVPRIKKLGVRFHPVTEDGSVGRGGLVTDPLEQFIVNHTGEPLHLAACGPEPMLKAVNDLGMKHEVAGELSLEAPMPCGIGVCLGCVVPRVDGGHSRVCVDGPVFDIGEIAL